MSTYLGAAIKRKLYPTVVCYHGCVLARQDALIFRETVRDIKLHIQSLLNAGYKFLLPSEYRAWQAGLAEFDQPVTCLHYDDCLASTELIIPWLISKNIPCGIAVITRRLGKIDPEDGFARWDRLKVWVATGLVELMSHTHNMHHLTLIDNADSGLLDVAPVLEGPCWIDDGDVVYRAEGDSRWYWDFSHVDTTTLGVPLFGTDPYDETTPITTTLTVTPKVTGAVTILRLWVALSKPSGSGYDANVQIRASGALVWDGIIRPKVYETRTQWVEREFYSISLDSPFAVVSGTTIQIEFKTLNAGVGVSLVYGIPTDDDGHFRTTTTCRGLFREGSQGAPNRGWQYIDYPAGDRWPVLPCIILAFGTGRSATLSEYTRYVNEDCASAASSIVNSLNATFSSVMAYQTYRIAERVPVGWDAPNRVSGAVELTPHTEVLVEGLRIALMGVENFMGGDAYSGSGAAKEQTPAYVEASNRSYSAIFEFFISSGDGWLRVGAGAIWRISKGFVCDVTPFVCPPTGMQLLIVPLNGGPNVGGERKTRWPIYQVDLLYKDGPTVPAPAPNQLVYPFGSYLGTADDVVQSRPGFKDITPELKTVFLDNGLTTGYTIQAFRNTRQGEFREPDLRQTEWALGRWLAYGDQAASVSAQNLATYSGYFFHDVQHRGVDWQVSMEADPIGNATIKSRAQVLDYVAFDAWAFDGEGGIVPFETNDGGTYDGITYPNDKAWLQARGVRCTLIMNNNLGTGDPDTTIGDNVVNDPDTHVPLIVAVAVDNGWDGITCNLEALSPESRAAATSFYRQLARALHAAGKILHATVPAPTGTSYDADFWVAWCDHGEIAKVCDAIKVMSYTETGPGTAPGPAAPDSFWALVYDRIRQIVPEPYWPRIFCGCRAFGHKWDVTDLDNAEYVTYHDAIADGLNYGQRFDVASTEIGWGKGNIRTWCGTPLTVDRSQKEAVKSGFGGIGLWKLDDGDIEEFFPVRQQIGRVEQMAFLDVNFPSCISFGSSGGPNFSTSSVSTQSGFASRNARWVMPLHSYDPSLKIRTHTDFEDVKNLFMIAKGKLHSFRFKDWVDFKATDQEIGVADGATTNFQLTKTYSIGPYSMVRKITKPVTGTLSITLDHTVVAGWTVNSSTGLVSFASAPATGIVRASFEFDVHVHFDTDSLPAEVVDRENQDDLLISAGTVSLEEVRE